MGWKAQALTDRQDRIGAARKMGSCMRKEEPDDDQKPDLLAHYRPVAIRAVAAALTLKRNKPDARPLRETEYSGPAVSDDADWDDEPGVSFIR